MKKNKNRFPLTIAILITSLVVLVVLDILLVNKNNALRRFVGLEDGTFRNGNELLILEKSSESSYTLGNNGIIIYDDGTAKYWYYDYEPSESDLQRIASTIGVSADRIKIYKDEFVLKPDDQYVPNQEDKDALEYSNQEEGEDEITGAVNFEIRDYDYNVKQVMPFYSSKFDVVYSYVDDVYEVQIKDSTINQDYIKNWFKSFNDVDDNLSSINFRFI